MSASMASVHDAPAPPFAGVDKQQLEPGRGRINSIDLLRGIVMVIMMLDHTRDFVHYLAIRGLEPTDLSNTSVKLFLTRWITHFCAPVFVFLAGTGAYLQLSRGKNKSSLSRFLITRGFWLILLEFTWVRICITFNVDYRFLGLAQVIWVIGVSMIVLAFLIHLPLKAVGAFGLILIGGHNLLDKFRVQGWRGPQSPIPGFWTKVYILLHQSFEAFPVLWFFPSPVVFVLYPIIPWVGVMAAGFAFGRLYEWDVQRRLRVLVRLGVICTALFFVIRFINRYGDPAPWVRTGLWKFTAISFLNVTKYPPSLLFLLMTLGPAFLVLAWFEYRDRSSGIVGKISDFFITFGRVPLFFYLLQWPTAHLISVLLHLIAGKPVRWMFGSQVNFTGPPPGVGFNLLVVYACWIAGVLLLYPVCKWFAGVKARHRSWWLSYL